MMIFTSWTSGTASTTWPYSAGPSSLVTLDSIQLRKYLVWATNTNDDLEKKPDHAVAVVRCCSDLPLLPRIALYWLPGLLPAEDGGYLAKRSILYNYTYIAVVVYREPNFWITWAPRADTGSLADITAHLSLRHSLNTRSPQHGTPHLLKGQQSSWWWSMDILKEVLKLMNMIINDEHLRKEEE